MKVRYCKILIKGDSHYFRCIKKNLQYESFTAKILFSYFTIICESERCEPTAICNLQSAICNLAQESD